MPHNHLIRGKDLLNKDTFGRRLRPLILIILTLFLPSAAFGEEKVLETFYASIYYQADEDLVDFAGRISRVPYASRHEGEQSKSDLKQDIDKIVYRVKTLLDMYPQNMRFSVRIYTDPLSVRERYAEHSKRGKAPIAFYSHQTKTIYCALPNLSGGIFAHEVAHAVINFYFPVTPPAQMQEILAQYVDKHLWDE